MRTVVPPMGVRLMAVRAPAGTTVVPVFSAHAGEMEDSAFKGLGKEKGASIYLLAGR